MTTKHTPGPWHVRYDTNSALEEHSPPMVSSISGNVPVCEIYSVAAYHANAHLIAAAPDMLEALEECVEAFAALGIDATLPVLHARAAIAKAKGTL